MEYRDKLLVLQEAQYEIKRIMREENERILEEKRIAIEKALLEATEDHKKEL
ncbi:MAG: hypothetical protein ACL7AX_13215 [Candidatus Arsenophonus phytopathogenicus]